jgi:hypothetical protein
MIQTIIAGGFATRPEHRPYFRKNQDQNLSGVFCPTGSGTGRIRVEGQEEIET